jgi:hypothetical protein
VVTTPSPMASIRFVYGQLHFDTIAAKPIENMSFQWGIGNGGLRHRVLT